MSALAGIKTAEFVVTDAAARSVYRDWLKRERTRFLDRLSESEYDTLCDRSEELAGMWAQLLARAGSPIISAEIETEAQRALIPVAKLHFASRAVEAMEP